MTKIFVYGTLKTNHGNWARLLRNQAVFVGEAKTVDTYTMLRPSFPVLLDDLDGHRVKGEVFECSDATVQDLDGLEGEGHMYHRRLVCVQYLDDRAADEVSIYIGAEYWRKMGYPTVQPNAQGLLEWKSQWDEQDDDSDWNDEYDVDDDPGEVVEPEDQDPGDVLGEHDERERS